jgi:Protein of unknown function (DUF2442)
MFLHVKDARYLGDYRVKVLFNNGREGVADLADALKGPVFESLTDRTNFSAFVVDKELETLVWPNGADLAPEYLYYQAFKSEPELRPQFIQWGYIT